MPFNPWRIFLLPLLILSCESLLAMEINDGHMHYNYDVWTRLPPKTALKQLENNGIQRAIFSSTPAEGTQILHKLAPDKIIPFIRPYRNIRDRFTYHSDPTIIQYLEDEIASGIYHGIGEFHLFAPHKDTTVVKDMMQLAADHQLAISAHVDLPTILTLVSLQPELHIIWAHCGMDHPFDEMKQAIESHPNLHCDLSFRYGMFSEDDRLKPEWKALLEAYPERFILGMDTYVPRRWAALSEHVEFAVNWLEQLSEPARNKIARDNIEQWFPSKKETKSN